MSEELLREKIETLHGSRRKGSEGLAAVRVEDMAALLTLPETISAKTALASSYPTKAEFDALLTDVQRLQTALFTLAQALTARTT
jgi:hypothetical protein